MLFLQKKTNIQTFFSKLTIREIFKADLRYFNERTVKSLAKNAGWVLITCSRSRDLKHLGRDHFQVVKKLPLNQRSLPPLEEEWITKPWNKPSKSKIIKFIKEIA